MSDARSEIKLFQAKEFTTYPVVLDPDWYWYSGSIYPLKGSDHFYSVHEEQIRQSTKGRGWKSFEHYKAFRGNPASSYALSYVHSGQNYPQGAYQLGTMVGQRALCLGYRNGGTLRVNPFGEPGLPIQGLPSYLQEQANGDMLPPPARLSDLEAIALRKMLPAVKQQLSLINSIIELKDFKSILRTTAKAASLSVRRGFTLRQQYRRAYRSIQSVLRKKPGEALAAEAYLQLQFNILPLISDVMAIQRAIASAEEQVRKLVNRAGRPQTTHFTVREIDGDDSTDASDAYYLLNQPNEIDSALLQYQICRLGRKVVNEPAVFHAEMQYSFEFSRWQTEHAQLLGLLDSLGVNLNPAIIWNAIPWSFVVDWLVGVSRWLNDRKTLNLEPRIRISRYLWSYKKSRIVYPWADISRSFTPTAQLPGLGEGFYPKNITLPAVHETSYKRVVGWPAASSIATSGVSPNELTLGSALVIARRRNRPRRG